MIFYLLFFNYSNHFINNYLIFIQILKIIISFKINMFENIQITDNTNRLSIKSLSTIKNDSEEKFNCLEDEKVSIKHFKSFELENDTNKTLNLIPNNFNYKIQSPFATYYSKKIPSKNRIHPINYYEIKKVNNSRRKSSFSKEEKSNENLKSEKRKISEEKFSISNVNFSFFSNRNKNSDLSDLNLSNNNNISKEKKIDKNRTIDMEDRIQTFDTENKENLNFNFHYNKTINCRPSQNNIIQTQNSLKYNLINSKNQLKTRNIENAFLDNGKNCHLSPFTPKEKKTNPINNYYSFFRKLEFKNKIQLPNFSWVVNQKNSNDKYNKKNNTNNINNNNIYNIQIINSNKNKKFKNKLIIKRNKNSLNKETQKVNVKFIDTENIFKIHRDSYYNIKNNDKTNNFLYQSEIYHKLTHNNNKK
jgi:hypothetical protein